MQIISKSSQATTQWTGGTTTQLYIYPETATLQERNFDFRISTARVQEDITTFSKFEGYERILMILSGVITLSHINHYSKTLKIAHTDVFDGSWETHAQGQVTDFNIIFKNMKGGCCYMENIAHRDVKSIVNEEGFFAVYLISGNAKVVSANQSSFFSPGDFLYTHEAETFTIETIDPCQLVMVKLIY